MSRKLSKLDLAVLRKLGRVRSGNMWVWKGIHSDGAVAWLDPAAKVCALCRSHKVPQADCIHPTVPDFARAPEALKRQLVLRRLDLAILHVGDLWHARIAPSGGLISGRDGYQVARSEGRALCLALMAMPGGRR